MWFRGPSSEGVERERERKKKKPTQAPLLLKGRVNLKSPKAAGSVPAPSAAPFPSPLQMGKRSCFSRGVGSGRGDGEAEVSLLCSPRRRPPCGSGPALAVAARGGADLAPPQRRLRGVPATAAHAALGPTASGRRSGSRWRPPGGLRESPSHGSGPSLAGSGPGRRGAGQAGGTSAAWLLERKAPRRDKNTR